ncbi:hypothetical protein Golax_021019 [Gossypium laxum]|uniref:P-type ATPase C-terminal domain-containing protein n=1 Tax=Gossypium laxum TaxID=34288 RepID=A0A7J9AK19_9ROSI|nr:hypothetical protein [Gossypium laxum]
MKQFHLSLSRDAESNNQVKDMKEDILQQIESSYKMVCEERNKEAPFGLVIDGKALEIALRGDVKDEFLQLAVNCASVICCRVSPKQKALITRLVKQYTGKTTLAIGDGANDVGMIQEADIGVGISGMEGMQAVMASDFSLPQFRFLERLLIVHGHWCYQRISKMVLYFVYKNVAFGLTLFYYELYTSFSGEVLYDDWYMTMFNVMLTSLPVIALGVLEQDVSSDICLQFPALYQQGPRNVHFSWSRIIGWILNGVVSSLVIFLANIYILSPTAMRENGFVADIDSLVYGALPPNFSGNAFQVLVEGIGPAPLYWMITVLVVVVSLLPYFIHIVIQRSYFPMDDHIIQEMEQCYKKYDVRDNEMWDFLISLKKLAVKRAIAIGHVQLANKFDLKVLQAPGIFPITFVFTC